MDDTQASIKTTEAAASRKRRSSILKSQRPPPRTPFSELEFNVATPTDTAKSRRVSFSRRTGVAEFITNEATTTWKNFYEEHNKSLESSGNETAANAPRPVVGQIGKRIFDQQFEEVEVVDIEGTLQTNTAVQQFQYSFNNVNLTQQLMAFELDCIRDDRTLSAPAQHFELNNITDHNSKVFGNDLSVPIMSEISNPISMNFSNVHPLGKCDDLEEIARDLERPHQHLICPGLFSAKDVSEYIEVDLNMTNVVIRNKDCDMSITDTIHSPEVQALAKQTSIRETKANEVVDKENIIINPYITPKESSNFAINEEFDKVLVFDGKKLTVQSERQAIVEPKKQKIQNNRSSSGAEPKRKTIVLNINDDLPNFIPDSSSLMGNQIASEGKKSVLYNDCDLSATQAVGLKNEVPKVFDDDMGNLSITQALPAKVITNKEEKRKTIIYDNNEADISITQAVPTNKVFVFEDELSFTQDLPTNVVLNKTSQNKTIYYPDGLDISVTNIISLTENMDTENYMSKISMTQAIPSNIIINEINDNTQKSMAYCLTDNIDIKQVLQNNIIRNNENRKTIVYDNDAGDISLTKAIPTNILLESNVKRDKINLSILNESENIDFKSINSKRKTIIYDNEQADISMTQVIPSNVIATKSENNELLLNNTKVENCEKIADKRKTIIYDNEDDNVSMTLVIPANILQTTEDPNKVLKDTDLNCNNEKTNKRKTIIYDNEDGNISMTQAIPISIIQAQIKNIDEIEKPTDVGGSSRTNERQTIIYNNEKSEVTMAQLVPTNIVNPKSIIQDNKETKNRRKPVIYDSEETDLFITQAMPPNIIRTKLADNKIADFNENFKIISNKRETIICDNNVSDVSMTQVIPTNIIQTKTEVNKIEVTLDDINVDISIPHNLSTRIILNEEKAQNESRDITNKDNRSKSLSNHPTEKLNRLEESKYNVNNMSITNPIPAEIISFQNHISKNNEIDANKSIYTAELQIAVQDILVYQTTENTTTESKIKFDYQKNVVEKQINRCDISKTTLNSTNDINCEHEENDATNRIVTEQISETSNNCDVDIKKNKKSILSELLDMSNASLVDIDIAENEIKYFKMMTNDVNAKDYVNSETTSNNNLSIRDSESEIEKQDNNFENIEYNIDNIDSYIQNEIIQHSEIIQKSLDKEDESKNDIAKPDIDESPQKSNRYFEKILSSDLQNRKFLDQSQLNSNMSVIRDFKSIRDTHNTKVLLDMLSDLTDGQTDEKYEKSKVTSVKNIVPSNEPKRLSFMPKRQSKVLSRENLLNNISMAQAALQLSRSYNNTDNVEDAEVSLEGHPSPEENCVKSPNKSVRISTEVVKTLHFDESVSDTSTTADMNTTPLKKTTFGETTFIGENKAKVIPTYLKDVSDGIKSLMIDLVKPTADIPLTDKPIKKPPSTCSTQIQANLVTSSQIEIDTELGSNSESAECMRLTESLIGEVAAVGQRAVTQALRHSFKPVMPMDVEQEPKLILKPEIQSSPGNITRKSAPSPVIVFDHLNPLNNILLTQMDCSKIHAYNPLKENAEEEINKSYEKKENQINVKRISTHYVMDKRRSHQQSEILAEDGIEKIDELNAVLSNISKPLSIDRSTEGIATELKHTEINTVIAMKNNRNLLENNSSLTLVDDALDQPLDIDMEDLSPVKIIYKVEEDLLKDSDVTSNDEYEPTKPKKRSYSPTRQDKKSAQIGDITPKPISKMQKISLSPKAAELAPKSSELPKIVQKSSQDKKISPKKRNSVKQDVTVQQLITDCYKDAGAGADRKARQNLRKSSESSSTETLEVETMSKTFQSIKSHTTFTSSKNILLNNLLENRCSEQKTVLSSNPSSLSESSSYTDIMSKIQMLPFMRTKDCEWEICKKDMWSFLLLRSRVRLVVRFTRNHDTPITCLTVDPVHEKEKEPSSTLCVRLAAEAMRYECTQCGDLGTGMGTIMGTGSNMAMSTDVNWEMGAGINADAIPGLLRRCMEVSRLAILWARVMRDARLRLAYVVNRHGEVTFKVVNFQLRAVWEVHLRIELVVDDDQHLACPRAGLIRVVPVLGGVGSVGGPLGALLESVRKDWGHAPVALWKIFHYLKNKTKDEDLGLLCLKNKL